MDKKNLETLKKPNKAFLKFKAIRVVLEIFKVKRTQFSNCINENETEIFSKNFFKDFIVKFNHDLNYYLNNSGHFFVLVFSSKMLNGRKIEVKK